MVLSRDRRDLRVAFPLYPVARRFDRGAKAFGDGGLATVGSHAYYANMAGGAHLFSRKVTEGRGEALPSRIFLISLP